jgi:predicted DNA repair protein MutK
MSGLLALMDDVAAIAKVAAASVDDVAAAAAKAGTKTAGVVIDDAAVTPKYVQGFAPARELPMIGRIARGSLFSKIVILLPAAMLMGEFAPWLITPLLMLGGTYLCFEGAEKIYHALFPHGSAHVEADLEVKNPGELEERKVRGAIKTDFILSAEIMAIALSELPPDDSLFVRAAALGLVGAGVTIAVYGSVALIVKMDDVGLYLASTGRAALEKIGLALVKGMPVVMRILSVVGTAAMLWVGGSIMIHGLHHLGMHHPYKEIHSLAEAAGHAVPSATGLVEWAVTAACDGVLGLVYGLLLIPVVTRIVAPLIGLVKKKDDAPAH